MGVIMYGGINYSDGIAVIPNPEEPATENLSSIKIGNDVFDIPGSGKTSFYQMCHELCYGATDKHRTASPEKVDFITLDTYNDYSSLLSYDSTTKEFTVLQDFQALIVSWVYQYTTDPNHNLSKGSLYITSGMYPVAEYEVSSYNQGSNNGAVIWKRPLRQGEYIYVASSNQNTYAQHKIKIYWCTDLSTAELMTASMLWSQSRPLII